MLARRFVLLALLLTALQAQAFDLQSHRGGRGLRPENTLASFENAIRMGTTTLEMDIAITADGVPVISHDPALNPAITRDAKGEWLTKHEPLIKSLTPDDINDLIQFLHVTQGKTADGPAAARGAAIFAGRGGCYDCHGHDAHGDSAIGAAAARS